MASDAQSDKKRELDIKQIEIITFKKKIKVLQDHMVILNEQLETINERLEAATEERASKQTEIDRLTEQLKSVTKRRAEEDKEGFGGRDRHKRVKKTTPRDGIKLLMKELSSLDNRITGKHTEDDLTNELLTRGASVQQVNVSFEGESAVFRVPSDYTFDQLLRDAARYFDVDVETASLRDQMNSMWPNRALVSRELTKAGPSAKVKLHSPIGKRIGLEAMIGTEFDDGYGIAPYDIGKREPNHELKAQIRRVRAVRNRQGKRDFVAEEKARRERQRKMYIWLAELIAYLLFVLACVGALAYSRDVQKTYYITESFTNQLIKTSFPSNAFASDPTAVPQMQFDSISKETEIFSWMKTVLLPVLFPPYGTDLYTSTQRNATYYNVVMNRVRLRQHRVTNTSCNVVDFTTKTTANTANTSLCYAAYSAFSSNYIFQSDYGSWGSGGQPNSTICSDYATRLFDESLNGRCSVMSAFTYSNSTSTLAFPIYSESFYDGGGYFLDVAANYDDFLIAVTYLKNFRWLDEYTRAMFIDFNLYNPNYNYWIISRVGFELTASGLLVPSYSFRVIHLVMYSFSIFDQDDYTRFLCVIYKLFFGVALFLWGFYRILIYGFNAYFGNGYDCLDFVLILVILGEFSVSWFTNFIYSGVYKNVMLSRNTGFDKFTDMSSVGIISDVYYCFSGLVMLFAFFRVFRFFRTKTIMVIWDMMNQASIQLSAFTFVFVLIFISYVTSGYILYGTSMESFQSYTSSFSAMLQMLLGSFDYTSMSRASSLSPYFATSFLFLVFFILLNVFSAILNDAYRQARLDMEVKAHLGDQERTNEQEFVIWIQTNVLRYAKKWFPKCFEEKKKVEKKNTTKGWGRNKAKIGKPPKKPKTTG
eukprot:GILK01008673.1.p1 GENE.GILK01008673.1~~GILK01008673.1.p1  ORF type:complete len:875 (+),score=143.44 GILK01008673.1:99-2723(+)